MTNDVITVLSIGIFIVHSYRDHNIIHALGLSLGESQHLLSKWPFFLRIVKNLSSEII